jgi:polyphosphate kinase 2 (PPK2 family)
MSKNKKMKRKKFDRELEKLQGELVKMQQWVVASGAKICIIFEGRDTAGKGGVIKRIMERVSPRVFHHVALPAPTDRQKSQMYFQRYMPHLPAAGEVTIFDRSWYNSGIFLEACHPCRAGDHGLGNYSDQVLVGSEHEEPGRKAESP